MKPYFTLLQRDNESAPWRIEFGAYDCSDVESEKREYRDIGIRASNLRILKTPNVRQATIISAVAKLNASELLPEDKNSVVRAPK